MPHTTGCRCRHPTKSRLVAFAKAGAAARRTRSPSACGPSASLWPRPFPFEMSLNVSHRVVRPVMAALGDGRIELRLKTAETESIYGLPHRVVRRREGTRGDLRFDPACGVGCRFDPHGGLVSVRQRRSRTRRPVVRSLHDGIVTRSSATTTTRRSRLPCPTIPTGPAPAARRSAPWWSGAG